MFTKKYSKSHFSCIVQYIFSIVLNIYNYNIILLFVIPFTVFDRKKNQRYIKTAINGQNNNVALQEEPKLTPRYHQQEAATDHFRSKAPKLKTEVVIDPNAQ